MSSVAVRDAFEAALATAYPSLPLVPIENVQVEPPKDAGGKLTDFMGVLYFATEQPISLGRHCYRESGTLNVLIYRVAGRGARAAAESADAIRDLFAGRDLTVAPPGMRLGLGEANPLSAYLGRPGVPTGAYYVGMVGISYEYDFTRTN